MDPRRERDFDIVLVGATGFTGALTAEYLARTAPTACRWAIAGRNARKLGELRERLVGIDAALAGLPCLTADSADADSLRRLAESASVVVSTVGPYLEYGEPLVAACAEAGTDYADLSGEPEFVDRMYLQHHDRAAASGARLVHACGFDSIPEDLGALFTVRQLPQDVPIRLTGILRAGGAVSGGTLSSAINQFSRVGKLRATAAGRKNKESRPEGRRARAVAGRPHRDSETGLWLVPLPTIDPQIVVRSARQLADYGPDFTYSHYAGVGHLPVALGGAAGLGALMAAAQVPPLKRLLLSRVPGGGPSEARRARSWFSMRFRGEGAGQTVRTEVSGGDPGYGETAKMLAESALCLALDDNPEVAGQTTTAVAMGQNLIDRLVRAGIGFRVTG